MTKRQLKGDLSTTHVDLDIERCAQIQAKEFSNAQKLQIEFIVMEHNKNSIKYQDELRDYAAMVYLVCLNEVTQVMTKKGFKVSILVLVELKKSLAPREVPTKSTYQEVGRHSSHITEAPRGHFPVTC